MDELNVLKNLDTVKAPPDFEQRVMAQISLRKRSRRERRRAFGLSLAGAFASLVVVAVLLNVFVLQKRVPLGVAERAQDFAPASSLAERAAAQQSIPVIETLDYATEIRSRSTEPQAIYLLEQVSETTVREIKY